MVYLPQQTFIDMLGQIQFRWLPACLLLATLPATAQARFALRGANAAENDASVSASGDIPLAEPAEDPSIQIPPEELGDLYEVRQYYVAAIREYTKVEHPSAAVWNKEGIAYQMMFAFKEAMRCYKQSLKLNRKNAIALNNLATVQDQMKDFSAAEGNYRKALKLNPNSATLLKNLGTNLLMQHKYDEGANLYKQALAKDPKIFDEHSGPKINDPAPKIEHGTAAYFKAKSCARAGLTDCALTFLNKAFNEGAATVKKVNTEDDFENLRGTPALTRLLARQQ
jgi:tetratricopeptide (TPR) repeat protein